MKIFFLFLFINFLKKNLKCNLKKTSKNPPLNNFKNNVNFFNDNLLKILKKKELQFKLKCSCDFLCTCGDFNTAIFFF